MYTASKLPPISDTTIHEKDHDNTLNLKNQHVNDGKTGIVDVWPASSMPHAQSAYVPASVSTTQPKPKFLKDLETYLNRELSIIGRLNTTSHEARMQVFRQVFEFLIQEFKTYKPMLASIKNEYETYINELKDKVVELEPLKAMIITIAEECDQKIMQLRDLERKELEELKNENKKLTNKIDDIREDKQTLAEMIQKLQEELSLEHEKYRNEADARKLLVQDINDLRYQYEELITARDQGRAKDNTQEDAVMLRIALERCRKDLVESQNKITEYQANYGDVIPRRDFEKIKEKSIEMTSVLSNLKKQFTKLSEEHSTLQTVYKQVLDQRNNFAHECDILRRSATPRPDWSKCAPYIEGGNERWTVISQDRTSDQLVDILLAEIAGADPTNIGAVEYFEGLGLDESIPRYLRYEGKIRNFRTKKKDVLYFINELWEEKAKYDTKNYSNGNHSDIQEFIYEYLKKRHDDDNLIVEWGYNLHYACQRLSKDPQIGLFYNILSGEVDEIVHHKQQQMFANLKLAMSKASSSKEGCISIKDFSQVLRKSFANKTEKDFTVLEEGAKVAIDKDTPDVIKYMLLFETDADGKLSPFLLKIMEQQWDDRLAYISEIEEAIGSDKREITVEEAREVIKMIDPSINPPALEACLSRGFDYFGLVPATTKTDVETFVQLLRFGDTNRFGRPGENGKISPKVSS
ncbi:Translin-associated factor X-interacting protein 1 [Trichoplax sp. H2]|nr:Translin-associated factor X-interacting protein 1 [Trichoplax sp. H2]|eukprot:RDD47069.1 Translin-associated factor X-interacting protein 1 [Trichoplax sp. H2]